MAREEISDDQYKQTVFEDGGSLVIDLNGVEEAKFELVPKGIYEAEIDTWDFGMSQSSGAPMFTGVFRLDHPDFSKVKLYSYFSFSKKALPFTKASLNRFAKDVFGSGQFDPQKIADSGVMLGKKVRVKIGHEEFEGEKRARIQNVLPAGEGNGASGGDKFFG